MRSLLLTTLCAAITAAVAATPLAGCSDDPRPPPRTVAPSPTEGVGSAALAALLVEHWDLEVALDPLSATYLGDHRLDAVLPPVSRVDVEALRARRRALLDRITALDAGALSERDQITHAVLVERLTAEAGLDVCDYERWAISPRASMVGHLDRVGDYHPLLDSGDAASYRTRIEAMPVAIDSFAGELAAGAADGETSGRRALQGVIDQLRAQAARSPADWPMIVAIHDGYLDAAVRDRLVDDVTAVITSQLAPAYRHLATVLEGTVLPAAREVDGLAGLASGPDCYAAEIPPPHHAGDDRRRIARARPERGRSRRGPDRRPGPGALRRRYPGRDPGAARRRRQPSLPQRGRDPGLGRGHHRPRARARRAAVCELPGGSPRDRAVPGRLRADRRVVLVLARRHPAGALLPGHPPRAEPATRQTALEPTA